jgi:hypothetical protein
MDWTPYYNKEYFALELPEKFNDKLENLPSGIKSLTIGRSIYSLFGNFAVFNQPINKGDLPNSLTYIQFGYGFNQPIDGLPVNLLTLYFGNKFNQPIEGLPVNLRTLYFGDDFNQPIDGLPANLVTLYFGDNFNQPIDGLPNSIIELTLGYYFNKPANNLPFGLKRLFMRGVGRVEPKIPFGCTLTKYPDCKLRFEC